MAASTDSWPLFTQLYLDCFQPVYCFLMVRVRDSDLAEDLTAETFFRARRSWPPRELKGHAPKAWLFQIARNLLVDHIRQQERHPQVDLVDEEPGPEHNNPNSGRNDDTLTFKMAFTRLPEQDQQVLSLRLAGLSNAEIATTLEMNEGAAAMACLRAIQRLQKIVGE